MLEPWKPTLTEIHLMNTEDVQIKSIIIVYVIFSYETITRSNNVSIFVRISLSKKKHISLPLSGMFSCLLKQNKNSYVIMAVQQAEKCKSVQASVCNSITACS